MGVHAKSSNARLTPAESQRSRQAAAAGLYKDTKWSEVFGPGSSAVTAQRLRTEFPSRYHALKQEYRYAAGLDPLPPVAPTDPNSY